MKPPTATIGTATAQWRERLASRDISRGPRQCHDGITGEPGSRNTAFETTGSWLARQRFLQVIVSQLSVSEICLDADVTTLPPVPRPVLTRRRKPSRRPP